ncbi:hypothetical protein ACQR1I_20205 [Bradyrhizobium sp. HKCCYLS2038]|uniref:hypothetical protein n=1 Tax=unclassified Bradyrhizobium TaxID=2631580 RepID=UPI003EBC5500
MIYVVDGVLLAALLFFVFLPITDRRTVRMKLAMIVGLAVTVSMSLSIPRGVAPTGQPSGFMVSSTQAPSTHLAR